MFKRILQILVIIIILAVGGYVFLTCSASSGCSNNQASTGKDIPTITDAPFIVQTPSRSYYAVDIVETTNSVTLLGYYELVGGDKWTYRASQLILKRAAYGKITVSKR